MKQNKSSAVMAQRNRADNGSLDFFPTPPWATRALMEHVIKGSWQGYTCLEPACGEGHMARPLREYFGSVTASDIHDYGYGDVADFLLKGHHFSHDWVITNPPFNRAEEFIYSAQKIATVGVAMLVRTAFLESVGRYNRIFRDSPPTTIGIFSERVPMLKGRLDRKASTATSYCWLVWQKALAHGSRVTWIPPCRKRLERDEDYD